MDKDFALFYGVMLGDGCLSVYNTKERGIRHSVNITGDYYTDKRLYHEVLVPVLKTIGRKSVSIKERPKNGTLEINFPDEKLLTKISKLGFPIGKKGINLIIPKILFDKNLVKYVIQGFFATDGSLVLTKNPNKYYPRLEGHGIAKDLIKQISDYLNSLGLKGHFYVCKRKIRDPRWVTSQQQYRFQFNGEKNLLLFNDLIGFVNPKHQKKFRGFVNYSKEYDESIKGIRTWNHKPVRDKINKEFIEKVAALGIAPRTSCS